MQAVDFIEDREGISVSEKSNVSTFERLEAEFNGKQYAKGKVTCTGTTVNFKETQIAKQSPYQ